MTTRSEFLSALLKEGAPIFLASGDARGSRLTLHVATGSNIERLRACISSALFQTSAKLRVSVRSHRLDRLAFPRSLEHWLRPFSSEGVLYDPTMIAERARELLRTAQSCRATLGKAVDGIFCEPHSRSLLVLVRDRNLAELQSKITCTAPASQGSIRVVSALPQQNLIPVDARSAGPIARLGRLIRRWRAPGALALAISAASAVPAAAHTNAGHLDFARTTLSIKANPASEYGVLSKLSVFADGARLNEADAFVSVGLKMYFGDKLQLALNNRRPQRRCEGPVGPRGQCMEEYGQTGTGSAGTGSSGPGS
jgi:hypothetical protein